MSFAEILVQAGTDAGASRRLKIAADLARRFEARLVGVFLEPATPALFAPGFEMGLSEAQASSLLAEHRAMTEELGGAAHAAFEVDAAGLETGWRVLDGADPEALVRAARTSDLLVMPGLPGNRGGGVFAPVDAVALASGIPVLAAPVGGSTIQTGRRVLVAWDGSREAARALHGALPLLKRADDVMAVVVDHPPNARQAEETLEGLFDRHGCKGSVMRLPQVHEAVGDVVLRHAAQTSADLIVMGLYGHSRLREFILGGASREMLERSTVPLFLAH
jgi:nucleotide-binding universal stress UspA family protein